MSDPTGPALAADGLRHSYGRVEVLHGVDLEVAAGEVVGLIGPNGAGKSTCFKLLAGVEPLRGGGGAGPGRVRLLGRDVGALPLEERARLGLGYLPQTPSVFRGLSALQNVVVAVEATGRVTRRQHASRARALLEEVGLAEHAGRRADRLSGGERRKLEIARLLALEPRVLLLDEPFTGLDPIAGGGVRSILSGLRGREVGVLLTDHDARAALSVCDRAYLLLDGRVVLAGTVEEVAADRRAREAYLGDA